MDDDVSRAAERLVSMRANDAVPACHIDDASNSDASSEDGESSSPTPIILPVHVLQRFLPLQAQLTHALERCFAVAMQDINTQPIGLFALGICAGGVLGVQLASFSIGYVSMALFTQKHCVACEMLLICIGMHETLNNGSQSVVPLFCLGKELRSFLHSRRMSAHAAAALSLYSLGVISPTPSILVIICFKLLYDAFLTVSRWHT